MILLHNHPLILQTYIKGLLRARHWVRWSGYKKWTGKDIPACCPLFCVPHMKYTGFSSRLTVEHMIGTSDQCYDEEAERALGTEVRC